MFYLFWHKSCVYINRYSGARFALGRHSPGRYRSRGFWARCCRRQRWVRQTGTDNYDDGLSAALDRNENIFITGRTLGSIEGTNAGDWDVFLMMFDPENGAITLKEQFGSAGVDYGIDIAIDDNDSIYN
ncbi:MAG: hypothetical protein GY754_47325 [bacterium]|nr:hypothetical protein [bacterium]